MATKQEIIESFKEEFNQSGGCVPECGSDCVHEETQNILDFLSTALDEYSDAKLEEVIERVEGEREEIKYGMDVNYGDTDHPHPSVIYGKNKALDTALAILHSMKGKKKEPCYCGRPDKHYLFTEGKCPLLFKVKDK